MIGGGEGGLEGGLGGGRWFLKSMGFMEVLEFISFEMRRAPSTPSQSVDTLPPAPSFPVLLLK